MQKALLVYNPAAGPIPVRPFIWMAERVLVEANWYVETMPTRSGAHATLLARQAAEDHFDAVFAVGGDGTVGQVAGGLLGSDTALGVLPAGTSNVWARELGLTPFRLQRWWSLRENARLLANAPKVAIDAGLCGETAFVMWAGMGLDALTVQSVEPRIRLEKFFAIPEYALKVIQAASSWHGVHMRITADGQLIEGRYMLAIVNNIRHYMGGLANLSPDAYINDGILDLWLFAGESLPDALRIAFDLWMGRHVDAQYVQRIPFRELHVQGDAPFAIHLDGDPLATQGELKITVQKQQLQLLLPPSAMKLISPHKQTGSHG